MTVKLLKVSKNIKTSEYRFFSHKKSQTFSLGPCLLRALIVDDDLINLFVINKYLQKTEGLNIESCANGKEALEIIKIRALEGIFFDFILMDCNMPVMNGLEAAMQIKQMIDNREIPNTKIIGVTAGTSSFDFNECLQSGMTEFLLKPFSKEQLLKKLTQIGILLYAKS